MIYCICIVYILLLTIVGKWAWVAGHTLHIVNGAIEGWQLIYCTTGLIDDVQQQNWGYDDLIWKRAINVYSYHTYREYMYMEYMYCDTKENWNLWVFINIFEHTDRKCSIFYIHVICFKCTCVLHLNTFGKLFVFNIIYCQIPITL